MRYRLQRHDGTDCSATMVPITVLRMVPIQRYRQEAKAVFVPTKIDTGKYQVELTKIDTDFYQICGTDLYIETKYCHEYAIREEAILNITSNYGYTRGEVIFIE